MSQNNLPRGNQYYFPTNPYTLEQAIARRQAATGSVQLAMDADHAPYNGHCIVLHWNDFRGYYVGEYHWGERVVVARSKNFLEALKWTKSEYDSQGAGASLHVTPLARDEHFCQNVPGLLPWSEEEEASLEKVWRTWKYGEITQAIWNEEKLGCPALTFLRNSTTKEEYIQAVQDFFEDRLRTRMDACAERILAGIERTFPG